MSTPEDVIREALRMLRWNPSKPTPTMREEEALDALDQLIQEREQMKAERDRLAAGDWTDDERRTFLFEATKASYAEGTRAGCEELAIHAADMDVEIETLQAQLRTAREQVAVAKRYADTMDLPDLAQALTHLEGEGL